MNVIQYTLEGLTNLLRLPASPAGDPLRAVEEQLGVGLPPDMHTFAAAFPGGRVHNYEPVPWDPADPAGVVATTRRLRAAGLRPTDVALGTDGRKLTSGMPPAARLASAVPLQLKAPLKKHNAGAVTHLDYTDLMLEQLESRAYEKVRAARDERHPELTKRATKRWRHRQQHEAEKIELGPEPGHQTGRRLPDD